MIAWYIFISKKQINHCFLPKNNGENLSMSADGNMITKGLIIPVLILIIITNGINV